MIKHQLSKLTIFTAVIMFVTGAVAAPQQSESVRLCAGVSGRAIVLAEGRSVVIPLGKTMSTMPVSFEFKARLDSAEGFNILMSSAPKMGAHWEIYTTPGGGNVALYIPQLPKADLVAPVSITDGKWHSFSLLFTAQRVQLTVDGVQVIDAANNGKWLFDDSPLILGAIANERLGCNGAMDDLRIISAAQNISSRRFDFDRIEAGSLLPDGSTNDPKRAGRIMDEFSMPTGSRYLDEVQDEKFAASSLHGDDLVEMEGKLPANIVRAMPVEKMAVAKARMISLNGEWRMKGSEPSVRAFDSAARGGVKAGWYKPIDRSDWDKVQVPTSVQNALLKLGKMPDPFWNTNTYDELVQYGEPKSAWWVSRFTRIEQQEWWFARQFTVPAEWKGSPVRLYFDGIDYSGSVYVNGVSLGHHAGMFGGPSLDVTKLVKYGQANELVVRVDRVPENWSGILKGSPGWGWHYGHLVSLGIWRDVSLQAVPQIEINSPYVVTKSIKGNQAIVQVEYYVDNHAAGFSDVSVTGTIKAANFKGAGTSFENTLKVPHGRSRWRTTVVMPNVQPWWPMNYGKQNLYTLQLTGSVAHGSRLSAMDSKMATFGVRTIEMRPAVGANAESDYRWQFVINGVPMFIKGANWCWSDPMLQCDPAKYERLLELARRGGIQMFRTWGGGIVETDTFYKLCDEKGLMVYQEFPYCWGPPDFPGTDAAVLDQQVTQVVKRNRNHPSLVMWGGGNENGNAEGADEGLFLVGRRCRQFDPSRPFHRTDPWGGSTHNWAVFHQGSPMDSGYYADRSVFYGEYGLPSMPSMSSSRRFLPDEALKSWPPKPENNGVIAHLNQFSLRDPIKTMRYADYGPIKSWDDYIEYSQMAQGDWLRFVADGQRAGSNANKTGFWFYKMSDLFPGHSWAVVDFYGSPKSSYYRAKQACKPQAAYATVKKLDWSADELFFAQLHLNNDSSVILKSATVLVSLYGSDLKPFWEKSYPVSELKSNQRILLDTISVKLNEATCKPFILAVSLQGANHKPLSDNWYWFNYKAKSEAVKQIEKLDAWAFPEDRVADAYQAYADLPEARLRTLPMTSLTCLPGKGSITVKNTGSVPVFNVMIDGFPDGYKDFLDDNSFFLRPGEVRVIPYELGPGSSMTGVKVRAWNAPEIGL